MKFYVSISRSYENIFLLGQLVYVQHSVNTASVSVKLDFVITYFGLETDVDPETHDTQTARLKMFGGYLKGQPWPWKCPERYLFNSIHARSAT